MAVRLYAAEADLRTDLLFVFVFVQGYSQISVCFDPLDLPSEEPKATRVLDLCWNWPLYLQHRFSLICTVIGQLGENLAGYCYARGG